jgi:HK97 family phage major capsid protein
MLGERLGRITNRRYTTGSGAGQPEGVTVGSTLGVTTAVATEFTADELYNLKHSVDPAYRLTPHWMFADSTLLKLKKLKDGEGRYLWQASLAGSTPDTLDGDPIQVNQHMPAATSALRPIVYGDFSKYVIRDIQGIRTKRLGERYAEFDQEAFVGFLRTDGKIVDAGTNPLKYMLMA